MRTKHVGKATLATGLVLSLVTACSSSGNSGGSGGGSGGSTSGSSSKAFYAGKTIEIISAAAAGGGADTSARLLANYMTKFIAGHPKVKVVNISGGGGIQGGNAFASRKSDGTHLVITSSTVTLPGILHSANVNYDLSKDVAVWEVPSAKLFYAATSTGVKTVSDLTHPKTQLVTGGTAPGSTETDAEVVYDVLGIYNKMKFVYGYKDSSAVQDAVESGETNFSSYGVGSFLRTYKSLIDDKKATIIFDSGIPNADGTLSPDPNLPGVPTAEAAYKTLHNGQEPSGDAWKAFVMLTNVHAWALLTEKNVPAAALAALNAGFSQIVADKDFISKYKAVTPYTAVGGADAAKWSDQIGTLDPALISWLKTFISKEGK